MKDYRSAERRVPLLVVPGQIVFPGVSALVRLTDPQATEARWSEASRLALFLADSEGRPRGYGTLVEVESRRRGPLGLDLTLRGLARISLERVLDEATGPQALYEFADDTLDLDEPTARVLMENVRSLSRDILGMIEGGDNILRIIEGFDDPAALMAFTVQNSPIPADEKYGYLATLSPKARGLRVLEHLARQKEALKIQVEMNTRISEQAGKNHREHLLREQLKTIQAELGEGKPKSGTDYRARVATLPEAVRTAALEEVEKLEQAGPTNPEAAVSRNWLDLVLALPWDEPTPSSIHLGEARRILDADHHGLTKVKDLILQHLAVLELKKDRKGTVLLLVGPPGVGKTSLGQSIARALGRPFIRASLGGVRDDAEIRGHRRTYLGALPGRILSSMKRAGAKNPVFLLDEIDKLSRAWNGDPASALLEVLDPEQNHTFQDHYLDLPYDLSQVFFIATANSVEGIPAPLLDRMEVVHLSSYTEAEKFAIAREHLVPKQLELHGLTGKLVVPDEVLTALVTDFTREAGVRDLQRRLQALCRSAGQAVLEARPEDLPLTITVESLETRLGDRPRHPERALGDLPPGVATGLAWTPVGGDILFIETAAMPGTGQLILTGQLGDVMKESARIALSLVRSQLGVLAKGFDFATTDIHIHVPSGAIPKDGPSAGTALFTALASLVVGRSLDPRLAMTGEVTLRGAVTPVGGIKEKLLAAHRAGIRRILLPRENERDLKDLPAEVRADLQVDLVDQVGQVLSLGLGLPGTVWPDPALPRRGPEVPWPTPV